MTQPAIDSKQLEMIMEGLFGKKSRRKIHALEVSQLSESLAAG